jgi:nucleoporin NDC1
MQAMVHVFRDNDRLSLGIVKPAGQLTADSANHFREFLAQGPNLLGRAGVLNVLCAPLGTAVYVIFMRGIVWRVTLFFLRPFYNLPRTNMLPSSWPFSFWILGKCVFAGFLLAGVWQAANAAFSIFLVREPLKHGKPLTSESKDPNGSLLNGLKSRKLPFKVRLPSKVRHWTWRVWW